MLCRIWDYYSPIVCMPATTRKKAIRKVPEISLMTYKRTRGVRNPLHFFYYFYVLPILFNRRLDDDFASHVDFNVDDGYSTSNEGEKLLKTFHLYSPCIMAGCGGRTTTPYTPGSAEEGERSDILPDGTESPGSGQDYSRSDRGKSTLQSRSRIRGNRYNPRSYGGGRGLRKCKPYDGGAKKRPYSAAHLKSGMYRR